jgi:hypothetical protein
VARWVWLAVAVLVLAALAVPQLLPPSYEDYQSTALKSAQDALAQVRTVREAVQADLDGKVLSPYLSSVLDDARKELGKAADDLANQEVPDDRSAALQAQVTPLLSDAVREVNEAGVAADSGEEDAERMAVDDLGALGDKLESFVDGQR